jgi:hypothetical protein
VWCFRYTPLKCSVRGRMSSLNKGVPANVRDGRLMDAYGQTKLAGSDRWLAWRFVEVTVLGCTWADVNATLNQFVRDLMAKKLTTNICDMHQAVERTVAIAVLVV